MHSELRIFSEDEQDQQERSMEEQLDELYPKLQRYCQFLSHNMSDSEDLVQEALLKAWQQYRHQPVLTAALLNKIARNVWIDTVRKRSRETLEEMPDQTVMEAGQIDDRFEAIHKLMNQLTPKQAVMFTLKEGFRFQLAEIAELLNTSEPAVKAAIHRAKQRLEKQEPNTVNPLIEQYWETDDHQVIERILHETLRTQDPTILIESIPFIRSLAKETGPVCAMRSLHLFKHSSANVYMAA